MLPLERKLPQGRGSSYRHALEGTICRRCYKVATNYLEDQGIVFYSEGFLICPLA